MVDGRRTKADALSRYHAFSDSHRWKFEAMRHVQGIVPRVPPRGLTRFLQVLERKRVTDWAFNHYLRIAPPEFAGPPPAARAARPVAAAA